MTWVREVDRHECRRPQVWATERGSVWMCDHCGKFWIAGVWDGAGCWSRIYNPLRIWWLKRASK